MSLIQNALGCILSFALISGCSNTNPTEIVKIQTVPIEPLPPIVPKIDDLRMRDMEWIVITESNYEGVLMRLRDMGQEPVLYALTPKGYSNMIMNQADIMKIIRQQKEVILIYKRSYE